MGYVLPPLRGFFARRDLANTAVLSCCQRINVEHRYNLVNPSFKKLSGFAANMRLFASVEK